MIARARPDGGVEGQQVGLVGDVVDDADLVGDLLHRLDHVAYRTAAFDGVIGGLAGNVVGDLRAFGVLCDRGGHLLHRGGGFLDAGGLLAGGLAQRLRGGADFLGGRRQRVGGAANVADDVAQAFGHVVHRTEQAPGFIGC